MMEGRAAKSAMRPLLAGEEGHEWARLKSSGSPADREALFSRYWPLARRIARRYFNDGNGRHIEFQELTQLASLGLLQAIDRYDPELGVPFRYYCTRRIVGSILNGLSKHSEVDSQISHGRRIYRERVKSLAADERIPETIEATLDFLGEIAAKLAIGLMLDQNSNGVAEPHDPSPNAYDTLVWSQALKNLRHELTQIDDREQKIIRLHYLEGLTFEQVAAVLGLTKGRISQIHKATLALLRKRLSKNGQFKMKG
jgi:RNA polymerase sigma factor FliA